MDLFTHTECKNFTNTTTLAVVRLDLTTNTPHTLSLSAFKFCPLKGLAPIVCIFFIITPRSFAKASDPTRFSAAKKKVILGGMEEGEDASGHQVGLVTHTHTPNTLKKPISSRISGEGRTVGNPASSKQQQPKQIQRARNSLEIVIREQGSSFLAGDEVSTFKLSYDLH
jgi:hypothetical protein